MLADEVHVWHGELDRAASRRALREVLGRYLGASPATIELRLGEHGKPALAGPATYLQFNLSHSGGRALIAVARGREVGVDIERIRPRRNLLHLAGRTLEPAAAEAVRAAAPGERLAAFHAAWARREAVAKCHGTGLRTAPPSRPVAVVDLDTEPGFSAALAVAAQAMPPLRHFVLAPDSPHRPCPRHLARAPR